MMTKSHRHGKRGKRGRANYFYIARPGSGVFNSAVYMVQTRNLARMPSMLPIIITKDKRYIRPGAYTTLNRF